MTLLAEPRVEVLGALGGCPALLVVDVQRSFADPDFLASYHLDKRSLREVAGAVETCRRLVESARANGVPVYWIELATELSQRWRASHWLRSGDPEAGYTADEPCVVGTLGAEWYGLAPLPGEARIRKQKYSGFLGTNLEQQLRADGVSWLAVAGLTTECCVASTANDAMQLDWPVLVVSDASAAYTPELHAHALEQLALNVALITKASELEQIWAGEGESR